jgi:hypothetical protein
MCLRRATVKRMGFWLAPRSITNSGGVIFETESATLEQDALPLLAAGNPTTA